jgi:hypothetical protein
MRFSTTYHIKFAPLGLFLVLLTIPSISSGAIEKHSISTMTRVEVDPTGAYTRTTLRNGNASLFFNQSTGKISLSSPNVQWVIDDGGLNYIPTRVALGARGNQAFYGCQLNNERTRLFSTTTTSALSAPVWDDTGLYGAYGDIEVDASDDGNAHVALAQFPINGDITRREVVVFKYTSDSSTPDWTYIFPDTINSGARIRMSRDGSYIAAAMSNNNTGTLEIAYFDSESGTPLFTDSFAADFIRGFDMTDDGGLLYINVGTMIHIYDTEIQSIIYSVDAGASFDSHTISGDGSRFAFGGFNFMKCYQWNGSTYEFQFQYSLGGSVYCARCDLSADASTLAAAFYYYSPGLVFKVISIDATSGNTNFEADFTGSGSLQNAPQQIVTNEDGSRIVYGGFGDQFNSNPEVMVFEGSAAPVASIDTRGSVFDVDISQDGIFVASGSKSIHANEMGNGGDQACLYMGGQDLYLDDVPALMNMVTFNVEGSPGEEVLLAGSLFEVEIPTPFGTLVIDRDNYFELGIGIIPESGLLELDILVPNRESLVGRKIVSQALLTGGTSPHLTNGQVFWILP